MLLWCIDEPTLMNNIIAFREFPKNMFEVLFSILSSKYLNWTLELSFDHQLEVFKSLLGVIFVCKKVCPT